ncbi:hypothetical protein [Raineyella sp. W15-4]|uniref:hypothetical protein n=1 Tax=Raineyella sp. W15-4 TaxID=3081651 RepID=UPI0029546DAC|nr:hypothetical protein [Raineyella sp. W15-4]WOQ15454.1 hypothetical protein R0145_09315 [Raineyella sp. W15-4]
MRSNLVLGKLLLWVATGLCSLTLLLSTAMFLTDEDRYGPEGITQGVALYSLPGRVSLQEFTTTLDAVALAEGVNVYKSWPAPENGILATDYFVFAGDPGSIIGDVQTHTFPTFGGRYVGRLYPASSIERYQLLGGFFVHGSAEQAQAVMESLASLGADVKTVPSLPAVLRWPIFLTGSPWGGAVVIAWVAVVLAGANLLSLRLAVAGLRLSVGMSYVQVLGREAGGVLIPALLAGVVPSAALLGYAFGWAAGYRWASIITVASLHVLIQGSAVLAASALFGLAVRGFSIGRIMAGKRPVALLASLSVVAIVGTSIIASAGAAQAFAGANDRHLEQQADSYRAAHSNLVFTYTTYAIVGDDVKQVIDGLAESYRQAESTGGVLLTQVDAVAGRGTAFDQKGRPTALVANTAFLGSLDAADASLRRHVEEATRPLGGVALLIPSGRGDERREIISHATDWLSWEASLRDPADRVAPQLTVLDGVDLGVVPRLDYNGADTAPGRPMYLVDPVMLVTDARGGLFDDHFYAGSGAFKDRDSLVRLLDQYGVSGAADIEIVAQASELYRVNREADYKVVITGMVLMVTVLSMALVILSAIYLLRNRVAIFLLWTTGRSYLGIHWRYVTMTGCLVIAPSAAYLLTIDLALAAKAGIVFAGGVLALLAATTALLLLGRQERREALVIS